MSQKIIDQINKRFGKGSIRKLGDESVVDIDVISTQCDSLDKALGVGGIPRGRITEIFGPESSGKTTLTLHLIAETQQEGNVAAFIDAENAFDPKYAKDVGINIDELLFSQPDSGEEALEMVELLVGHVSLIVIDSVSALVPKAELEGSMGDSVTEDTPVVIRDKNSKELDVCAISSLYCGAKKFYGKRYTNKYKKVKEKEILTNSGWKNIKAVFYKKNKNKKKITLTNTLSGVAQTTGDHSLFVNGQEKKPTELKIGDKLDIKKYNESFNNSFINDDVAWILGYFCAEGSYRTKNSFSVCDTNKKHIHTFKSKLEKNFSVYTHENTRKYNSSNSRLPLHVLQFSRNETLTSLLEQCRDKNLKEKKVPKCILNSNKNTQKAFLNGFNIGDGVPKLNYYSFSTSSFLLLGGISFIFNNLGIKYHINSNYREKRKNKPEFNITESKNGNTFHPQEIRKFIELPAPKYLYDIETEDGTFVGGAGNIIHHNSHVGLQARLMSQAMRKLTGKVKKTNTAIVFINQIREKVGITYGSNETTSGGRALRFYSSIRLDIRRIGAVKNGDEIIGNKTRVRVKKNKVASPFKAAEFEIIYGRGINRELERLEALVRKGVVEKAGSWYRYNGEPVAQGTMAMYDWVRQNEELLNDNS